jgi:uncharacterized protein (DUF58 family)
VTRLASPRLRAFSVLGVVTLIGGLASGSPELVAVSAPFLLLVCVGLLSVVDSDSTIEARFDRTRALEGETVRLLVTVTNSPSGFTELSCDLPQGLTIGSEQDDPQIVTAGEHSVTFRASGRTAEVTVMVACEQWGAYRPSWIRLRSRQGLAQFVEVGTYPIDLELRVYPLAQTLRRLFEPLETQLGFGDLVSRSKGEGLEFADLRAFGPGDDPRRINWRVSASGRGMWVNDRHPERNSDVVLLVDTLASARRGVVEVLDLAVRAAAAIAAGHLGRHDRVGLITFGEPIRWIQAGMGDVQRYRILDTLMESHVRRQLLWRGVRVVPPHALPAKALVIGVSALLDGRAVEAFAELRGRGFDVAILEIPPERFLAEPAKPIDGLARRIWRLEREAARSRFARHGMAVVQWNPDDPLQRALEEARGYRRAHRRARG